MRLEVNFSNDKMVAFPKVDEKTIRRSSDGKTIRFNFGAHYHEAEIFLDKVDFMESMED